MKANRAILLILLGTVFGCIHNQAVNSPCTTFNSTLEFKPKTELLLAFGNDAIQAAITAMFKGFGAGASPSVPNLTDTGKNVALETAKANGKNPSPDDVVELEKYLSRDVAPTIKQNPRCDITVSSIARPYLSTESVTFKQLPDRRRVIIVLMKNTGQSEAAFNVTFSVNLDGYTHENEKLIRLGPGQDRRIAIEHDNSSFDEIDPDRAKVLVTIRVSYPPETGRTSATSQEMWRYDSTRKIFILASQS